MESKVLFRTFIAIPLEMPPELKETLTILKKEFRGERIRWVDPGQMHLTLRFLGDITEPALQAVAERFGGAYHGFDRSVLHLQGLGTFSHRSELKVLWAGIRETGILQELYAATQGMLEGIVAQEENRAFRPHLTLARMKRLYDAGHFLQQVDLFRDRELGTCALGEVVFYRSVLQPSGAVHEVLTSAAFNSFRSRSGGHLS